MRRPINYDGLAIMKPNPYPSVSNVPSIAVPVVLGATKTTTKIGFSLFGTFCISLTAPHCLKYYFTSFYHGTIHH